MTCGGWSSAHGAVAARVLVEHIAALFVDALPAAYQPQELGRRPRQRLEADRTDLSLLLVVLSGGVRVGVGLVVIRHEAGHDVSEQREDGEQRRERKIQYYSIISCSVSDLGTVV